MTTPKLFPLPLAGPPSQPIILDGSGNGIAQLGPVRAREHWQVLSASVRVSTNTKEATCDLYVGNQISSATFVSHSTKGSTGDVCGLGNQDLQPGMYVWAQWKGGDVGAIATLSVVGTYSRGGSV